MKGFFGNFNYRLQQWMQGRYGLDELSRKLSYLSLILLVLSVFPYMRIFYLFAIAFMVWSYARCFSKNIVARRSELNRYYRLMNVLRNKIALSKKRHNERKTHCYFRCPKCGANLRVPKGKGKIEITCNVCKHKMIKKT